MDAVILKNIYSAENFNVSLCMCKSHREQCPLATDEQGRDLYGQEFKVLSKESLPTLSSSVWSLDGQWDFKHQFHLSQITGANGCSCNYFQDILEMMETLHLPQSIALKILKTFGDESFKIIFEQTSELKKAKLTSEEILMAYQSCEKYRSYLLSTMFLIPFGCQNMAGAIVKVFHETTMFILEFHPYDLCIHGLLPFSKCKEIAEAANIKCSLEDEIKASIMAVIGANEKTGAMCLRMDEFQKKMSAYSWEKVWDMLTELISEKLVWVSKDPNEENNLSVNAFWLYRYQMALIENSIAKNVSRILNNKIETVRNIDKKIVSLETQLNCKLSNGQREGIKTVFQSPLTIITGGPGTGKTMLTKGICSLFEQNVDKNILLCAPTGCAASKMSLATGREANTIHHVLGLKESHSNKAIEGNNSIDSSLLIVDEASMLDCYIAEALFNAVSSHTRVIIIGDVDQLPSIASGDILHSLIQSHKVPVVVLDKTFRQAKESLISVNRDKIRRKEGNLVWGNEFQFVEVSNMQEAQNTISAIYAEEIKYFGLKEVMALSPYRRKTLAGVDGLNQRLREMLNPSQGMDIKCGGKIFRKGDRIMALENTADYCNGDIGFITNLQKKDGRYRVSVSFANNLPIEGDAQILSEMELCYATTIHKSQGAEFDSVIICVMDEYTNMLNRNMLYTAITRARKRVIVVGNKKAFMKAICRESPTRASLLTQRLLKY